MKNFHHLRLKTTKESGRKINNLVLFYHTFFNAYGGYVRLGTIENSKALEAALGNSEVSIIFRLSN